MVSEGIYRIHLKKSLGEIFKSYIHVFKKEKRLKINKMGIKLETRN